MAVWLEALLDGTHSNTMIAYARDADGRIVGFQRYATADQGRELSLDVPYRVPDAPNGVDERLIADVMAWAQERGAIRVSLAFAAFPELYAAKKRNLGQKLGFRAVHELDRWIRLESLYRFLRKFNAFGKGRYVMLRPPQVAFVLLSALTLEFAHAGSPARRSRARSTRRSPDAAPHQARERPALASAPRAPADPGRAPVSIAVAPGDGAADHRGDVARGVLHEAAATGRQVVRHARGVQRQPLEVDDVEVGLLAGGDARRGRSRPKSAAVSAVCFLTTYSSGRPLPR